MRRFRRFRSSRTKYLWNRLTGNIVNLSSLPTSLILIDYQNTIGFEGASNNTEGRGVIIKMSKLDLIFRMLHTTGGTTGVRYFFRFGLCLAESTSLGTPISADVNWPSSDDVRRDWLDVWNTPGFTLVAGAEQTLDFGHPRFWHREVKVARKPGGFQSLQLHIALVPAVAGQTAGTFRCDGRWYLSTLFRHTRPV